MWYCSGKREGSALKTLIRSWVCERTHKSRNEKKIFPEKQNSFKSNSGSSSLNKECADETGQKSTMKQWDIYPINGLPTIKSQWNDAL